MAVESEFISAINSRPENRTARLIYADWLEERGDKRTDLIRLEEEMRSIPVYSDRYWELKPCRAALRKHYSADWLGLLKYGTEYEPVFSAVPNGYRERWRLLREFTERWHGIVMPDVGGNLEKIRALERTLALRLPPSLKEWISFASDLSAPSLFMRVFRDCYDVRALADLAAVSLMLQGESDYYWVVRNQNLNIEDPPVDGFGLDYEHDREDQFVHHQLAAPHITTYAFHHMSAFLHGAGGGFNVGAELSPEFLQQLKEAFTSMAVFDGTWIFENENMIALLGPSMFANDEARFQVEVKKPISEADVPHFLWSYTRRGGAFHGIFTPRR